MLTGRARRSRKRIYAAGVDDAKEAAALQIGGDDRRDRLGEAVLRPERHDGDRNLLRAGADDLDCERRVHSRSAETHNKHGKGD